MRWASLLFRSSWEAESASSTTLTAALPVTSAWRWSAHPRSPTRASCGSSSSNRSMVPRGRFELPRPCGHRFLRPTRLPFRHLGAALFPPFGEARQYHSPVRLTVAPGLCLILAAACVQVSPPGNPTANQATTPRARSAASVPLFLQPPLYLP